MSTFTERHGQTAKAVVHIFFYFDVFGFFCYAIDLNKIQQLLCILIIVKTTGT